MSEQAKHTPTPEWALRAAEALEPHMGGCDGLTICSCGAGNVRPMVAATIARVLGPVVAAHDELVAAARRMLLTHGCSIGEENCADCRDMRAALAKAEAEPPADGR